MRLELESPPVASIVNYSSVDEETENRASEAQYRLRAGIKAAQSGERSEARKLLSQAAKLDPKCESAWLWLASMSEYPEELVVFLDNVLSINPINKRALEWRAATNKLLASTFIQRGTDAAEANQSDYAAECFNKSLEYDQENALAWLSLASLADSAEGKLVYLEKALSIEPENDTALSAYKAARSELTAAHLADARSAAVAGRSAEANELLNAVLEEMPESEEAWILRSHFADSFEEKIRSFERVLEINPENAAAGASLFSLRSILESVSPAVAKSGPDPVVEEESDEIAALEVSDEVVLEFAEPDLVSDDYADQNNEIPDVAEDRHFADVQEADDAFEPSNDIDAMSAEPMFAETFEDHHEDFWQPEPGEIEAVAEMPTFDFGHNEQEAVDEPESFFAVESDSFENGLDESNEIDKGESHDSHEIGDEPAEFEQEMESFIDTVGEVPPYEDNMVPAETSPWNEIAFDSSFSEELLAFQPDMESIPMPEAELELPSEISKFDPFKTVYQPVEAAKPAESVAAECICPFCAASNDSQAIACNSCFAILTLSDLEMLLSNQSADTSVLRAAVEGLERERGMRELSPDELKNLGIGHLNLRNFQFGYQYLSEAARQNPNDVVLASHVNSLLIRLDDIRKQEENRESLVKGKTILVVDDSPTVRKLIAGKLEKSGHNVICSADGIEAMEAIAASVPDLILLDITMPRMDGYQVCKLIRSNPVTQNVPVVMISGKDGFFDKVRGRMAGTSGYITKPFGPETLMKAVETYLNADQPSAE